MAAYNGIKWIGTQLDTILAQQDVVVSIYVSIDPSSDGTEVYLDERAAMDERITVLAQAGPFGCAAHNFYRLVRDVELDGFEYVALADQDDCWDEDKLAHAIMMIKLNDVAAYSAAVTAFWPNGREKKIEKAHPQKEFDYLFEAAGPGCTYVFTRPCVLVLQQFLRTHELEVKDIVAHDWLFYAFCRSQGYRWFIDSKSCVKYRQHAENELGANCGFGGVRHRLSLLRSGWYRKQVKNIAALCGVAYLPEVENFLEDSWHGRISIVRNRSKLRRRLRDQYLLAFISLFRLL
jgi:rhamnosyltransferase